MYHICVPLVPPSPKCHSNQFWFHELCWHSQADLKVVMRCILSGPCMGAAWERPYACQNMAYIYEFSRIFRSEFQLTTKGKVQGQLHTLITQKGVALGHLLLMNTDTKSYMGCSAIPSRLSFKWPSKMKPKITQILNGRRSVQYRYSSLDHHLHKCYIREPVRWIIGALQ